MIQYDKNFDNIFIPPFIIHPRSDPTRGHVQFCHNLIANLFEKEITHVRKNFPMKKSKDQYLITIYQASVISSHIM